MQRVQLVLFLLLVLVFSFPLRAAAEDTLVIGKGATPSSALRDGLEQIQSMFGRIALESESRVVNSVLEHDVIEEDAVFSASGIVRFYEGLFREDDRYCAVFRFPHAFLSSLRDKARDTGKTRFFASFDRVTYQDVQVDSFGERQENEWSFDVPKVVGKFVNYFIWHVDELAPVEVVSTRR